MEESKRRKKNVSKERKIVEVEEDFETRGEAEAKKAKKRKLKNMDDVNIENEEIGYKDKKGKRDKKSRRSGNHTEIISDERQEIEVKNKKKKKENIEELMEEISDGSQEIEDQEKKKKRKSKKEKQIIEDQENESKNKKKKRETNDVVSETRIDKSKKQKSKKSKSKEETMLCFVSNDPEEGFRNITVDENGELDDDTTEKFKAKSQVKSKKEKRNDDQSLSKNDEVPVEDESIEKMKKKEKRKKSEIKIADLENTDASEKKNSGDEALLYLKMWKDDRAKWTFKKVRQVWLLKHMFDKSKVPDNDFEVLLLYLEGLQGMARKTTISRAEAILESGDDEQKPEEFDLERVKNLLQMLN